MSLNLPPETLYSFMAGDFEDAWNSVAWNPSAKSRGNFMFARQAMCILEFASRLCWGDAASSAISDFSSELHKIEPKCFTRLPGFCADFDEFDLPYRSTKGDELLWAIFDLIRNGQAHQYQQIVADLSDQAVCDILDWGRARPAIGHRALKAAPARIPRLQHRIQSRTLAHCKP